LIRDPWHVETLDFEPFVDAQSQSMSSVLKVEQLPIRRIQSGLSSNVASIEYISLQLNQQKKYLLLIFKLKAYTEESYCSHFVELNIATFRLFKLFFSELFVNLSCSPS
jgi:hypothetical protein